MVPIIVYWTNYTATVNGRVLKLVPCENCSTEYIYVLEREGSGIGTSVYFLNDEGAKTNAAESAEEALQDYLTNDFDPIPCPVCGHYQRFMFPKLLVTKSAWVPAIAVALLVLGGLAVVSALYLTINYLDRPNERVLWQMGLAWSLFIIFALIGWGLSAIQRAHMRRFDPNDEDQSTRIERGRTRALTRAEFETMHQKTGTD